MGVTGREWCIYQVNTVKWVIISTYVLLEGWRGLKYSCDQTLWDLRRRLQRRSMERRRMYGLLLRWPYLLMDRWICCWAASYMLYAVSRKLAVAGQLCHHRPPLGK